MLLAKNFLATIFLLYCYILPSLSSRRSHHRRSVSHDARYLGFRFDAEPDASRLSSDNVLLNCLYTIERADIRNVRLEWRKDSAVIDPKTGRSQLLSNGSLYIEKATSIDEGRYQCVVHVAANDGSIWTYLSRKTAVRLPDLPKFIAQPQDSVVIRGHPVVFHCYTEAYPTPSVIWYHKEAAITPGGEYHVLPLSNSLEISSVQPRHEGEYKCVAEGAGKTRTSQTARLKIASASSTVRNEISFLTAPRPQTAAQGDSVLLECLATARVPAEVRWLKDSRQVAVDGSRIRRVGVSSLILDDVTVEDAGLYTCRASNTEDSTDRTVAVQITAPPHITTRPIDKVTVETGDVELECSAAGRPTPSISWLKNGEKIIASEYFVIQPNRLQILGLVKTDQAVYQCVAENDVGSQQASVQLFVDSADSSSIAASSGQPLVATAPLGLRALTIGSRVITLEWDPPVASHGHIMRYHVFFKEENIDRERMANFSSTSATLTSLQPDTLYLLRVAAENEAGMGKTSDHIKVTTRREQAVPGMVTNLVARALGSETIEVRWDPPSGGPVALRYKLFYIRNPAGDEKETQTITSATTYTFHGMDKYTEYLIRVEADGENGSGLSSETISVRTHSDVPREPPRDVAVEAVGSTSVRVTWKEPTEGINGDITGYRVRYKTKLRGSKGNTFVIDATEREYTISGLERDTQYLVKVAVVNHNGTGEFSDWLPVATPMHDKEEALLGAPRELRPQPGPDYILLSWLPPADESILVRGYQVGWGHNVPDVYTAKVAGNVLQYKIAGLKSGKDYVVSLRGSNRHGLGFPIYETVRTVSPSAAVFLHDVDSADPAMTPVAVRAEATSATSMRIVWTEPDPNAFNTLYTVRYSTSVDGNQIRTANSSDPWASINGLQPATEYEFAVRAIGSDGGVSQWSMAARNRTLADAPSSAPRDLTVLPAASGDPHSVSLEWQPPRYSNGFIEEYLIYYTDRSTLPDKDWIINYVPGDRLGHHVSNLLPKAAYYFKIQARNEKGYGPMSPVQSFIPRGISHSSVLRPPVAENSQWQQLIRTVLNNPMYMAVLVAILLLFILCIVLVAICASKSSKQKRGGAAGGYSQGRKTSGPSQGDLWINHASGSHVRGAPSDYMVDGMASAALTERLTGPEVVESPPPRYQAALQDSAYGSVSARQSRTPIRQSVSSYEDDLHQHLIQQQQQPRRATPMVLPTIGRAKPILASVHSYGTEDSQGTLSRSYHQSSTSLEGARQRTPQVVYTGAGRHQPIAKIDFNDSPYGSSSAVNSATPPIPTQAIPSGPPIVDGYRTLRGTPPNSNPLRSFTQLAGAPPQVRPPIVVAAGGRQLPVGRATAQPRVNVANIYSPYASCSSDNETEKKAVSSVNMEMYPTAGHSDIQPSLSMEELNTEMENVEENLDNWIDDLQKMHHDFSGSGSSSSQLPA